MKTISRFIRITFMTCVCVFQAQAHKGKFYLGIPPDTRYHSLSNLQEPTLCIGLPTPAYSTWLPKKKPFTPTWVPALMQV